MQVSRTSFAPAMPHMHPISSAHYGARDADCAWYPSQTDCQSAERHVLAERYKTKMCRNYLRDGVCPYEVRCMFAHGEEELRTCEMNLEDGLVTEEAIKSFQRVWSQRQRQQARSNPAEIGQMPVVIPLEVSEDGFVLRYRHNPYGLLPLCMSPSYDSFHDSTSSSIGDEEEYYTKGLDGAAEP